MLCAQRVGTTYLGRKARANTGFRVRPRVFGIHVEGCAALICVYGIIRVQDDDVLSYVNGRMSHLRRPRISKYQDLQNAIREEVVKAAAGMYVHFPLSICAKH